MDEESRIRTLDTAIETLMGAKRALKENDQIGYCDFGGSPRHRAEWKTLWSDRHDFVCAEHVWQAYAWYRGDNSYDQEHLRWERLGVAHGDSVEAEYILDRAEALAIAEAVTVYNAETDDYTEAPRLRSIANPSGYELLHGLQYQTWRQ